MIQAAIFHLHRGFQPSFDVEKHPFAIGMFPYRPHQKLMVDAVKETLDVEVKNPVVSPASLTCNPYGLYRRLLWPIPIRVRVETLFQDRLQVSLGYRLGNAVCNRWDAQWPRFPIVLWYIDPTYGWWKIAA
jgi:hypothetical protein